MTYNELWHLLAPTYGDGEAKAIAQMVYEVRFGLSLSDIYLGKDTQLSANSQAELAGIAERLQHQEPVQYILGEASFCGRTFHVAPGVLIPRPETAELCQWISQKHPVADGSSICPHILDIGTGSGCIAITLALDIPHSQVTAWDISPAALEIARENAQQLNADVTFEEVDILSPIPPHHSPFDIIVSNPPYICNKEREQMEQNVLEHEPHTALFVPDEDPLLFYRTIAAYGLTALKPGGELYFEINPIYANEMLEMLSTMSYHDIEIKEDQFGKPRMINAQR